MRSAIYLTWRFDALRLARITLGCIAVCLVVDVADRCCADEATVQLLDGGQVVGRIESWDDSGLTIVGAADKQTLPFAKLLDVRWTRPVVANPETAGKLELVDGTRLAFSEFGMARRRASVTVPWSTEPLTLERDALGKMELRPATPQIETALDEIADKQLAGDVLVVAQRGSESMDYVTGVIGDVDADQAAFNFEGDQIQVKRSKIAAMVFYQPQPLAFEPLCELSLTDGSTIVVSKAALEGQLLNTHTPAGLELRVPVDMIVRADFSSGKVQYLSDLAPTEVEWTPGLGLPPIETVQQRGLPRPDSSFTGEPLSLSWQDGSLRSRREIRTYGKGLAIRSRTDLTYRLPPGMRMFSAIAGLNPRDAASGSVMLTISADDRVVWEGAVGDQPRNIDVELGKARRLHVRVDYGDKLDFGDQLHLVEARVTR